MNQKNTTFALSALAIIMVSIFSLSTNLMPTYQAKAVETKPIEWSGNTEIKGWTDTVVDRTIDCNMSEDRNNCQECQKLPSEGSLKKKCCVPGESCLVIYESNCTTSEGKPC